MNTPTYKCVNTRYPALCGQRYVNELHFLEAAADVAIDGGDAPREVAPQGRHWVDEHGALTLVQD